MRKILFKGKSVSDGEWVEGHMIAKYDTDAGSFSKVEIIRIYEYSISADYDTHLGHLDPEIVDENTICQYSGKNDKNCKRIFEGDLVQAVLPRSRAQNGFVWPLMPVVFRDGIFGLLTARDEVVPFTAFATAVTLEVKGNIHDHPEMLKGEKANG